MHKNIWKNYNTTQKQCNNTMAAQQWLKVLFILPNENTLLVFIQQ